MYFARDRLLEGMVDFWCAGLLTKQKKKTFFGASGRLRTVVISFLGENICSILIIPKRGDPETLLEKGIGLYVLFI